MENEKENSPSGSAEAHEAAPADEHTFVAHPLVVMHGAEEEGEPWLISYADMVTLLLGLFVILFSMSTVDKAKFESVKKQLSEYFGGQYMVPFKDLKDQLSRLLYNKDLGRPVDIATTPDGLEISFKSRYFFGAGETELNESGKKVLKQLVKAIKDKYKDSWSQLSLIAEGHSDHHPIISGKFRNNFEIAGLRALSVLQALRDEGFKDAQLMAISYGPNKPLIPPPDKAEEGQAEKVADKLRRMELAPSNEIPLEERTGEAGENQAPGVNSIYDLNRRVVLKITSQPFSQTPTIYPTIEKGSDAEK